MASTWRKSFAIFVIILTLATLWRVIIPNNYSNITTRVLNSSPISDWENGGNGNRQNTPLKQRLSMLSIEGQNQTSDWLHKNQAATYSTSISPPAPLQPHDPISIISDADFANQGWPGNGSLENPYYISDLYIAPQGEYYCIEIMDTHAHFVISNCWLEWDGMYRQPYGFHLVQVANGLIANSTCVNLDYGVRMSDSASIELVNNTCINGDKGISVRDSSAIRIINNTCFNTDFGLWIFDSWSTEVVNNTIKDSGYFGCEIYPLYDNILANNSLVNCGFFFGSWDDMWRPPTTCGLGIFVNLETQITGNTINQRPLILWFLRVGGTVPLGGGQVILLDCSSITVQDQNLTNASIGIFLHFVRNSWVVNNTCTGHSLNGIYVQNCDDITVNNNLCADSYFSGITLDQASDSILSENLCNNSRCGIRLFEAYDNQLINNICNHNRYGIRLNPAFGTELINNTCNNNGDLVWWYYPLGAGIWIDGDANTARQNRCNANPAGIEIRGFDNYVVENTCTNNTYGIILNSNTTPISNNLCVNNRIGIIIANYLQVTIIDNTMIGCGLYIAYFDREWTANVSIQGNTVNGRPLVFFQNQVNSPVPFGAGQIILFNCRGITVQGQTLTGCSQGLLVYCTNYSLFVDNVVGDNSDYGILLFDSHNNHFTRNIFTNNEARGISLSWGCQNNTVDWNIFYCNASHDARDNGPEFQSPGANIFDCNYWANYTGYDRDLNGFGDIPYNVTGYAGSCDLHPLMSPFVILANRSVERLLFLLQSVAILVIVIVVFVFIRAKFRRQPSSTANNRRSTVDEEKG